MYWLAALIPPVAVFLSTERVRTRVVSVALALAGCGRIGSDGAIG